MGPHIALLSAITASFSREFITPKKSASRLFEQAAAAATATAVASSLFTRLNNGTLVLDFPASIWPVVSAVVGYQATLLAFAYFSNRANGGNGRRAVERILFRRTVGIFCATGISAVAMVLFGNDIGIVVLFDLPIILLMRKAYVSTAFRAAEKQRHIKDLQENQARLADLYLATIRSLALAIDAKDQYTHQHILRVQQYAVAIALHMGLEGGELEAVRTGALLHDIGKLGVPEYVLLKPGRLTDDEFEKIKQHPEIGASILGPVDFPWPVLPVVKYHHERFDGNGYPEGLKGTEIPLTARIMSVADVYDALTSSRSYRMAWSHERAVEAIREGAGTQFDPLVVEAFNEIIDSTVQAMALSGQGPLVDRRRQRKNRQADESARAARAIGKAASELWAMYEVVQTLSSSLGLQDTLDILGRKIVEMFPDSTCLFLFRTASQDKLKVRGAAGSNAEYFEGATSLNAESISLSVMQTRTSFLGIYDHDDLMLNAVFSGNWDQKHSALIVPVVYRGEPIGTINLFHSEFDAFGEEDRMVLETIAERASMALYNGLLHDRSAADLEIDPLTGVRNIWHVTQLMDRLISEATSRTEFALVCIDLDSFSAINDCFGLPVGDKILREFAALVQTSVGPGGSVARYAGDGFVVLIEGAERRDAERAVERVRYTVDEYASTLSHAKFGELVLNFSKGISTYPKDGRDVSALLKAAEAELQLEQSEKQLGVLSRRGRPGVSALDEVARAA